MNHPYATAAQRMRYAAAGDLTQAQLQLLYDTESADNATIALGAPDEATQQSNPSALSNYAVALARRGQRADPATGYAAFKTAKTAAATQTTTGGTTGGTSGGSSTTTTRRTTTSGTGTGGGSITPVTPTAVAPASTSMLDNPYVKYGAITLAVVAGATVIGLAVKKSMSKKKAAGRAGAPGTTKRTTTTVTRRR